MVTVTVVERLEVVDVEHEDRERCSQTLGEGSLLTERVDQKPMVVEAGQVIDARLALHHGEKPVPLQSQRDLLRRGSDKVGVAGRERTRLTGDREDAMHVLAETEWRDTELTNVEPRLRGSGRGAQDEGPESGIAKPLPERPVPFKKAVEGDGTAADGHRERIAHLRPVHDDHREINLQ